MLELARLGVAHAGPAAAARAAQLATGASFFELEPHAGLLHRDPRARPRAASRSTASSRPAVAAHRRARSLPRRLMTVVYTGYTEWL